MGFCCIVPCLFALKKVWGNLTLVVENLQFTLPMTAALLKLLVLWPKREALAIINDMMADDWLKPKTDNEQSVMKKWAWNSRIISSTGNILIFATLMVLLIVSWLGFSVRLSTDIEGIDKRLLMQSYYYYDTSNSLYFMFTYFIQSSALVMGAISYTGIDSYLALIAFHVCAQFQNLNERLANLNLYKDFTYAVASCLREHARLLTSIEMIDSVFAIMLLLLLLYFGLLFCFYCFTIINEFNRDDQSVGRICYFAFAITVTFGHMCLYCVVGEILVIQCQSIFYTAYDYEWYELKPKHAKCMILLMMRANRPNYVTAGGLFPMTMATFCSLLKTSAGYVSVLLANQN